MGRETMKRHTLYVEKNTFKKIQKVGGEKHLNPNSVINLMIDKCLKGVEEQGVGYLFLDIGDIILSGNGKDVEKDGVESLNN